jgi:hypothetical protein
MTDGNRAEACGELPSPQGDETVCDRWELAAAYHENAFNENRVKYWLHEIKLHHSDLSDRPKPAEPLLEILMLELYKFWKLSRGLRFERSLSSSRFLRRRCISI